jgi:putative DNA primase/helicase
MTCPSDLRTIARALGGEVVGRQVVAPGPGHSQRDRSLSIRLSATAPEGFLAFSHAGDDFADCRDHVKRALGVDAEGWNRRERQQRPPPPAAPRSIMSRRGDGDRTGPALALWRQSVDPRGTLAERYLASRELDLCEDDAGEVLRWHPGANALLALFRHISTDEPHAVSRTFLDREGRKLDRRFLGPVGGAAIKLDSDDAVLGGLHIGEGVETCLAARQLGLRPTWALGSKGAIGTFPVLSGVECLTILSEPDAEREIDACAMRWHAAGREVLINRPIGGKDLNDAIRRAS